MNILLKRTDLNSVGVMCLPVDYSLSSSNSAGINIGYSTPDTLFHFMGFMIRGCWPYTGITTGAPWLTLQLYFVPMGGMQQRPACNQLAAKLHGEWLPMVQEHVSIVTQDNIAICIHVSRGRVVVHCVLMYEYHLTWKTLHKCKSIYKVHMSNSEHSFPSRQSGGNYYIIANYSLFKLIILH